jgi:hypothetical protein
MGPFKTGDVVGLGVNFLRGTLFFTLNGVKSGSGMAPPTGERWFPSVSMHAEGHHIACNFGLSEFVFDLEKYVAEERQVVISVT